MSHSPKHRVLVWPWTKSFGRRVIPNWLAFTLGRTIVAWRQLDDEELEHELEHVRQWARLGLRLPIAYFAESLRIRRRGGNWYRDNRFETEARAAAAAVRRRPRA
jgi:hypothetical protein